MLSFLTAHAHKISNNTEHNYTQIITFPPYLGGSTIYRINNNNQNNKQINYRITHKKCNEQSYIKLGSHLSGGTC